MTRTSEIELLLQLLDQAYDRKAWHGPNLKSSLRRVTAAQAAWRPGPRRRSIAEIAVHCAYWKYAAHRRLTGGKRGSFAMKGSNWFALPDPLDDATWRDYLKLLESTHRELRTAVASLSPKQLLGVPKGSRVTNLALIQGIAAHDLYHAGQVQLLKRLQS
jgi:hypothetical protein